MGATHFRLRTLEKAGAEMSLHILAYNLKRMIAVLGVQPLIQAMRPPEPLSGRQSKPLGKPAALSGAPAQDAENRVFARPRRLPDPR
jgi:hypothetical protein